MPEFDREPIYVRLRESDYTIAVVIRDDFSADETTVVFADPEKLEPIMHRINEEFPPSTGKQRSAEQGLLAALVVPSDSFSPPENPLPMAKVNFNDFNQTHALQMSVTDGIARTTEMLTQGAEFVPLQVRNSESMALHKAVGGALPPVPATHYVVPPDIRMGRVNAYYRSIDPTL